MSIRLAHIENGQIANVSLAPDDYVIPDDGTQMLEAHALAAGLQRRLRPGQAREQARQALREQWAECPAWLRGPYHSAFLAASELLDNHEDEAARALIEYAAPIPAFSAAQIDVFAAAQAQLVAAIAILPQ
jgi:hypothetical protein